MADRYGRADDAPDPNDPFLQAARYNDAEVEEKDWESFWTSRGVEPKTILYMAEQRAMKYAILVTEGKGALDKLSLTNQAKVFKPTEEQTVVMRLVMPTIMDGMAIGRRALELAD